MRLLSTLSVVLLLSACVPLQSQSIPLSDEEAANPELGFFVRMGQFCNHELQGRVVSDQSVDAEWIAQTLRVGPVECRADVIRMPLAVGRDASRTWVLTRTEDGLLFKHEHIEPDGSPSAVTQYGGLAQTGGTTFTHAFPADQQTRANFTENGIARSNTNVWTLTIDPDRNFLTYALARPATQTDPARDFRAEFYMVD